MAEVAPANTPTNPDLTFAGLDAEGRTEVHVKGDQKYVPYDRFKAVNDAAKAAKDTAAAEVQAAQQLAETHRIAAEKARAEVVDWQIRTALESKGIKDPEDIAEFKDRWNRLPADEAGKKPTAYEWANKVATAPPKWAQGYFGAPPAQTAAPAETPAAPAAQTPQVPPPPAPRVNGGTQPAPPPPTGKLTDAQVASMTPAERIANAAKIVGEQQVKNPQLRKAMGLPPLNG